MKIEITQEQYNASKNATSLLSRMYNCTDEEFNKIMVVIIAEREKKRKKDNKTTK